MYNEYFTPSEAISMTPLIVSYCRSLFYVMQRENRRNQILSMLNGLTSTNPAKKIKIKKLINKINTKSINDLKKTSDWVIEINKLGWECCKSLCYIDIPVWDEDLRKIIYLCFNKNTKQDYIFWHDVEEDAQHVKPYFHNNMPKKQNKVRKMPRV